LIAELILRPKDGIRITITPRSVKTWQPQEVSVSDNIRTIRTMHAWMKKCEFPGFCYEVHSFGDFSFWWRSKAGLWYSGWRCEDKWHPIPEAHSLKFLSFSFL
jgi:hypothetical protein